EGAEVGALARKPERAPRPLDVDAKGLLAGHAQVIDPGRMLDHRGLPDHLLEFGRRQAQVHVAHIALQESDPPAPRRRKLGHELGRRALELFPRPPAARCTFPGAGRSPRTRRPEPSSLRTMRLAVNAGNPAPRAPPPRLIPLPPSPFMPASAASATAPRPGAGCPRAHHRCESPS